jgi:hypothetical protein
MTQRYKKLVATVGMAGVLAASAVPAALAKNGADDPPNHNANDDTVRPRLVTTTVTAAATTPRTPATAARTIR